VRRGDLYLVQKPGSRDSKKQRVFAVVSRQLLVDSRFSTVICAPVFSRHDGLSTQAPLNIEQGLKRESSMHCDELVSLPKSLLTRYVGRLSAAKLKDLASALAAALDLDEETPGARTLQPIAPPRV
jgi:mRNA interferase MazF